MHTARHIVEKCLKGDLIRGRTVILVVSISTLPECRRVATYSLVLQTHNVAMVSPVADFLVDMGSDGRILSQGSLSSALSQDTKLAKEVEEEQQVLEKAEQEVDDPSEKAPQVKQNAGKLVVAEEMEEGHVGWDAGVYMRKPRVVLFSEQGRRSETVPFQRIGTTSLVLDRVHFGIRGQAPDLQHPGEFLSIVQLRSFPNTLLAQTWYLGVWASQYETHTPSEVAVSQ